MFTQVWLTIASVLATFNIHKSKDDTGSEEEVEAAYSDGAITCFVVFYSFSTTANRLEQSPRFQMHPEYTV